jgi:outer membrane protein OmpA-like peptidoglycan-associated protein
MLASLLVSVNMAPSAQAVACPSSWAPTGATITELNVSGSVVCEIRFTTSVSWTVPAGIFQVDAVVVGGGGGGSGGLNSSVTPSAAAAGNGGGGGQVVERTDVAVSGNVTVTIGAGGGGGARGSVTIPISFPEDFFSTAGNPGGPSSFGSLTALGGAGGGAARLTFAEPSSGREYTSCASSAGDSGGGVNAGGIVTRTNSGSEWICPGAGGAGAGVAGLSGSGNSGGNGGNGLTVSAGLFAGSSAIFGGGGGGGHFDGGTTGGTAGAGGTGGGGPRSGASTGEANTGGAGAGGRVQSSFSSGDAGTNGGSGIVIIRFLATQTPPGPGPTPPGPNPPAPGPNPGPNPPGPGPAPDPVIPAEPTTPGGSSGPGASGSGAASAPVSVPAAASPGGAVGLVGGQPVPVTVEQLAAVNAPGAGGSTASTLPSGLQQELPATNGSQLTVGETTIAVQGPQLGGSRDGTSLAIAPGAPVDLALSGFQAGTEVGIFVISADGAAVLIGTAVVDADGVVRSVITVRSDVSSGSGRLQIQGTDASGSSFAVALDSEILPPVAPVPTSSGVLPELRPGGSVVLNDQGEPLRATVERVDGTDIRIRTQQSTSNIQAVDSGGVRPLGAQGAIEVSESGFVRVGGSGFQPGSMVQVWMFSDPSFVGIVEADAAGRYVSLLQLPGSLKPGAHTLQSAGTARNGVKIAASAGLRVTAAESGSGTSGSTGKRDRVTAIVLFNRMSSQLNAAGKKQLDAVVVKVGKRSANVTVTGYVQASSNSSNDKTLSTARAQAVAKYLRAQGLRGSYTVTGAGISNSPAAQARSARVVVTFRR